MKIKFFYVIVFFLILMFILNLILRNSSIKKLENGLEKSIFCQVIVDSAYNNYHLEILDYFGNRPYDNLVANRLSFTKDNKEKNLN